MVRAVAGRLAAAVALLGAAPASAAPVPAAPASAAAVSDGLAVGDAALVARVPQPGQPEGIAVDPADGSFWTGSNRTRRAGVLWHYARSGRLLASVELDGHLPALHGINGVALDGLGRVYALDYAGSRIVRLDPRTGSQTVYATFADLPLCGLGRRGRCEPSFLDRPAWPNWATFAPDGTLYVSDLNQATIWSVPAGGGEARVWHQSPDYASIYSLNGMQLDRDGSLVFVLTASLQGNRSFGRGVIYRLSISATGSPGRRSRVAVTGIGDGIAIGASGRIYAPLSEPFANRIQIVDGQSGGAVGNLPSRRGRRQLDVQIEAPASVAFSGTNLLVTNHALYSQSAAKFAVFAVGTGEPGLPLHYPVVP